MQRIVIPGGSGYLGQALARSLVDRGDDVVMHPPADRQLRAHLVGYQELRPGIGEIDWLNR